MKLLYVAPAYPPMIGGTEHLVRGLATHASAAGHHVTVVTSDILQEQDFWRWRPCREQKPLEIQEGSIRVIRCPARGTPLGKTGLFLWRKMMVAIDSLPGDHLQVLMAMARCFPHLGRLEQTLAQLEGYDLVHAFDFSWEYPALAAWRYARERGIPFVVQPNLHLGPPGGALVSHNNTMSHQRHLLREADRVMVNTAIEREILLAWGIPPERICIVGVGFALTTSFSDPQAMARLLAPLELEKPFILFIGRVCRDKGAIHASEAVLRLAERLAKPPTLVLAGAIGSDFARYYRKLPPTARRWVHPLGVVSDEVKSALLLRACLLVLPSCIDSFGTVILEAWAHGKPVIGARAGGIPAVIEDGVDGLLVDWGRSDQLADAIARLLNDPQMAEEMGKRGHAKWLRQYTWQAVYSRQERFYREILQARTPQNGGILCASP